MSFNDVFVAADDEVDDDYWEEEDMFSRLEATRERLERELGCDVFMKAYKTVQVTTRPTKAPNLSQKHDRV